MASETEIERLLVRLVGDSASFQTMIRDAVSDVAHAARDIDKSVGNIGAHTVAMGEIVGRQLEAWAGKIEEFGRSVIHAFSEQEDADVKLTASLQANERAVEELFRDYTAFSNELERITTTADEVTISMLQQAESYGVTGEAAKRAVKNTLAMRAAYGTGSIRMLVGLEQGHAEMLTRFIPALRGIKDETAQAAKAQEILAKAFKIVEAEATTWSGSLKQLGNAFSNLKEGFGKILVDTFKTVLEWLKHAIELIDKLPHYVKIVIAVVGLAVVAFSKLLMVLGPLGTVLGGLPAQLLGPLFGFRTLTPAVAATTSSLRDQQIALARNTLESQKAAAAQLQLAAAERAVAAARHTGAMPPTMTQYAPQGRDAGGRFLPVKQAAQMGQMGGDMDMSRMSGGFGAATEGVTKATGAFTRGREVLNEWGGAVTAIATVIVTVVAPALYAANEGVKEWNKSIEKGIGLANKWKAQRSKRTDEMAGGATLADDKGQIDKDLNLAKKSLANAKKKLEEGGGTTGHLINMINGPAVQLLREEFERAGEAVEQLEADSKKMGDALTAAAKEATKVRENLIDSGKLKAFKESLDADLITKQGAALGLVGRELELYALKYGKAAMSAKDLKEIQDKIAQANASDKVAEMGKINDSLRERIALHGLEGDALAKVKRALDASNKDSAQKKLRDDATAALAAKAGKSVEDYQTGIISGMGLVTKVDKYNESLEEQAYLWGLVGRELDIVKMKMEADKAANEGADPAKVAEARLKIAEAEKKITDINDRTVRQGGTDLLKSLTDELAMIEELGIAATETEKAVYKLQHPEKGKGITDDQAETIKQAGMNLDMTKEGLALNKKWLSPAQKFNDEKAHLAELFAAGKLSVEAYNGELKESEERLNGVAKAIQGVSDQAAAFGSGRHINDLQLYLASLRDSSGTDGASLVPPGVKRGGGVQGGGLGNVASEGPLADEASLATIATGILRLVALAEQSATKPGITLSSAGLT